MAKAPGMPRDGVRGLGLYRESGGGVKSPAGQEQPTVPEFFETRRTPLLAFGRGDGVTDAGKLVLCQSKILG